MLRLLLFIVMLLAPGLLGRRKRQAHATLRRSAGPGLHAGRATSRDGRLERGSSVIALGSDASYVNHLAALYRHMAGIPTDQEPPAAR